MSNISSSCFRLTLNCKLKGETALKVFPLFATLALCLCLASPAAAEITPLGFILEPGLPQFFQQQFGSSDGSTGDGVWNGGVNFNPNVVDYQDTGCIPLGSFPCMGSYSGSFKGGSLESGASSMFGEGLTFVGNITDGSFSGTYEYIDTDNFTGTNELGFDFTSTSCDFESSGQVFNCSLSGDLIQTTDFPFCCDGEGFMDFGVTLAPEPGTLALLGSGLLGLMGYGRKRLHRG